MRAVAPLVMAPPCMAPADDIPIVDGIDTPPLEFGAPCFVEDAPYDVAYGSPEAEIEEYAKLMHAPEFIPGLMWDHEAYDSPPYTPPPADDRLHESISPAPRKDPRPQHRRGFPRLLTSETKFPRNGHFFNPIVGSSSNSQRPSSAHHGTTSNPTITPTPIAAKKKAAKAKPKTATKAATKSKLKNKARAMSTTKPAAPKKGEKKRKRPSSVSSEASILGSLLDGDEDDDDVGDDGLTPDSSRRKTHNVLERKRRNDLKNSYQTLREQLPALSKSDRAPTGQILTIAVQYIKQLAQEEHDALLLVSTLTARVQAARAKNGQPRASQHLEVAR